MRSVSRSPAALVAPHVMLAVIRFTGMSPGLSAPNVSCVILLKGPTGVMSVSPVARAATSTSRNVASTAITPIHQVMWNSMWPRITTTSPSTAKPPRNHVPGTSIRSMGSVPARRFRNAPMVPKARTTVCQFMKNSSKPDVTIIGTPIHRLHVEIFRKLGVSITPALRKCGASTQ